ncbi:MAG: MlaD family protein [Pontiellaceae bacterium]|jgi:phospholipid/cholesterol/gamma-HCH transport system substrate-binding protein|nr:MlaD family protein [Pontiellaceae bacterium]
MSDKYNKELSIEVLVGFFMFVILVALFFFTVVLSREKWWSAIKYPLTVHFNEVNGLRKGDNVFFRGMKVGVVKSLQLENNQVVLRADLDSPVKFREGYKVEVVATSMLGGKQLRIDEGPADAPVLPEGTMLAGTAPIDILDELGRVVLDFRKITDQISRGEGTLGKLIYDDAMYNGLQETISNLRTVSDKLAKGEGTLGRLLNEETVYNDLHSTVANLKEVSARLANGEGTLGKLLSGDDQLYQDLTASLTNFRTITDKIGSNEGTLGKLVNDDAIYVEAQKLLGELRAAIDDMRETSPVTTFSTIFFGAF